MNTVFDMLESAEKVDLSYLVPLSLINSRDEYIKLQIDQMMHGINNTGGKIGKYKNDRYASKKSQMNPKPGYGNVDLRLRGDFQEAIFMSVEGDQEIVVDSADPKSGKLQEMYGEQIFFLEEGRQEEFNPVAQEQLIISVEKQLSK